MEDKPATRSSGKGGRFSRQDGFFTCIAGTGAPTKTCNEAGYVCNCSDNKGSRTQGTNAGHARRSSGVPIKVAHGHIGSPSLQFHSTSHPRPQYLVADEHSVPFIHYFTMSQQDKGQAAEATKDAADKTKQKGMYQHHYLPLLFSL